MQPMSSFARRRFIWTLYRGIMVLAVAGCVWFAFGLAFWRPVPPRLTWAVPVAAFLLLLMYALRLRSKAEGFTLAKSLSDGGPLEREHALTVMRQFKWVFIGEIVLCCLSDVVCYETHHLELLMPGIGLVVSLHFLPLGRMFRVPTYYATGIAGTIVSLVAILMPRAPLRLSVDGVGLGLVLWSSAVYLLWRADVVATSAVMEG